MEFRETLLAAQRNQQQQSSSNYYYKAKFDPPKKEQKQRDRLSANIQKFLAKKDEEEKQKKLEIERKRDELLAMRDPKAMRKIQKSLKVFKSANKSVLEDAVDHDNTAVTREGPDQPDQDDYGYESQEAAAIYEKMMQKYSKIPEVPKFPTGNNAVKKDLKGTMERVKHALQHEDDPVPHKRRRKGGTNERDDSPPTKYEPDKEKKKEEQLKSEKPKIRKPVPPPMDFNQLLKLAEQKKSEPIEAAAKKALAEHEAERPMTKKQKREYEEEMARKQRRQERLEADKGGSKKVREEKFIEKEKKPEPGGFGRIPKLGNKNSVNTRIDSPKLSDRDRQGNDRNKHGSEKVGHAGERERKQESRGETENYSADKNKYVSDREKVGCDRNKHGSDRDRLQKEKDRARLEKEKLEREKLRIDKERLEKLQAERERIDRDIERLNRDREKLDKTNLRLETNIQPDKHYKSLDKTVDRSKIISKEQNLKKNIDLKSQNTYRIDKNSNERKVPIPNKNNNGKYLNGDSSKQAPRTSKDQLQQRNGVKEREILSKQKSLPANGSLKPNGKIENRKPMESGKMPPKRPDEKSMQGKSHAGPSKPKVTSFDFDKHINSIGKNGRQDGSRKFPPGDVRRKANPDDPKRKPKRRLQSDSEYDSEMDDFIDDEDENLDYSTHIKEIFGYDKSKYRYMDDDDDPAMESSFARQQREEYISKKIGIMEDLEDMRMEAMEKKKPKKNRRISDD